MLESVKQEDFTLDTDNTLKPMQRYRVREGQLKVIHLMSSMQINTCR